MAEASVRALSDRQKAKFREIDARLVARFRNEHANSYDIGVDLRALSSQRLWLAGGYPTLAAYVEQRHDLSPSRAGALKRVSRFPRKVVESLGWTKLELVSRLWQLLPGEENFEAVESYRFRVPTEAGVVTKALAEVSKRDLEAAIDLATDDYDAPRVPPAVQRFVKALEEGLAAVEGVRVRASGTALAPRLTILGLPFAEVDQFAEALAHARRTVPATPVPRLPASRSGVPSTRWGGRPSAARPVVVRRTR